MARSDKPRVPRSSGHRAAGDTGVPQRGETNGDEKDDPTQAVESGEPDETDRSRGRVIDESGKPAGGEAKRGGGKGEHWESGRHQS